MHVGSLTGLHLWGSHTYVCNEIWLFSLVNLSHVNLIDRTAKIILEGLPGSSSLPRMSSEAEVGVSRPHAMEST